MLPGGKWLIEKSFQKLIFMSSLAAYNTQANLLQFDAAINTHETRIKCQLTP